MIHWNVSPEIITLGPLHIRWYGLFFAVAFMWGSRVFASLNRTAREVSDENRLFQYVIVGTVLGARLGHCLFYDPLYYWQHPVEIFMVWKGGLASHGGAIGVVTAVWFYCRRHTRDRFLPVLDLLSVSAAFAGFFIRMGNLMNSEILGKPSDLPWAFVFERVDNVPRHPAQLYEALVYLVIAFLLMLAYPRRRKHIPDGGIFGFFLIGVFSARFGLEFLKEVQSSFEAGLPLDMGQMLSIPLIGIGVWLTVRSKRKALAEN